jgi:hypothetical protein
MKARRRATPATPAERQAQAAARRRAQTRAEIVAMMKAPAAAGQAVLDVPTRQGDVV